MPVLLLIRQRIDPEFRLRFAGGCFVLLTTYVDVIP